MSTARLVLRQVSYDNRSFWRNPPAAFFTFVFPLFFLVIFTTTFGNDPIEVSGRRVTGATFYVPAIAAFAIISACYTNLAMTMSLARERGSLKRIRGTPLPARAYMTARVLHSALIAALLTVIVVVFGAVFYDVTVPTNTLGAFVVTFLLGAATFSALGLAVTTLIPNADSAPGIVNFTILPLLFVSGYFFQVPPVLESISSFFPAKPFLDAMSASFDPFEQGSGLLANELAVLGIWGAIGLLVAIKRFSWEPRR
jgi:ABC-2 type transport system permease protein